MVAKKMKLKMPEIEDISTFASLMAKFGARPEGVDLEGTPTSISVPLKGTRVPLEGTPTPKTVPLEGTSTPISVDLEGTVVDKSLTERGHTVPLEGTRVPLEGTPTPQTVPLEGTKNAIGVPSKGTIYPQALTERGHRVPLEGTPPDPKDAQSAFWFSKKIDIYLIGFWNILLDVMGTDGHTVSIRPLAKRFGFDKSLFHRLLKRLEASGMLTIIPQKEGTFIQVLLPVSPLSQHEEDVCFKKQLPLSLNRDYKKIMELRGTLNAIVWGCLAAGRDTDELSGTTIDYLVELSRQRSPEYICGLLVKYIKVAKHPLAFLQTVLQKEPDPLSQAEINQGQETLKAGEELLKSISRLDEIGLNGMRNITKPFAGLKIGKTLENTRATLESLQEKHNNFISKWGTSTE